MWGADGKQLAKLRVKAEKTAEERLGSQLEILTPIEVLRTTHFIFKFAASHHLSLSVNVYSLSLPLSLPYLYFTVYVPIGAVNGLCCARVCVCVIACVSVWCNVLHGVVR